MASSWWWFDDDFTSNSFKVKRRLRFTFASSIDAVSVSRAEGTIVVARRNWGRRDFAVIAFIHRAFGVRSARSLNQRFVGVSSNGRVWAPRALDSKSVVDTGSTVNFRASKVVFTSWGWWRSGTGVEFRSTTLGDWSTVSFNKSSVWWLNGNVLWTPSALDTKFVFKTGRAVVASIVSRSNNICTSWGVDWDWDDNWWRDGWRNWWRNWWWDKDWWRWWGLNWWWWGNWRWGRR